MDTKNKINAFSLVELIVGITISMILMTSIWVFVNSWMSNIFLQQKSLENASNINNFVKNIYENFSWIEKDKDYQFFSDNWILFKSEQNLNTWWFTYIWIDQIPWYYCSDPNSEDINTNHIFIKNFIPFIENTDSINNYKSILLSNEVSLNWVNYKTIQKRNIVVDNYDNIVIWKEIFWDDFISGWSWTGTQLNSPTWIASDWDVLYVSDTLNNRILYMSGSKIYKLLDSNDWLDEPTGLYYNNIDNYLLVSNSWLWEVLKITSEQNTIAPDKTFNFSWISENDISRIYINFFKDWSPENIESISMNNNNFEFWSFDSTDDIIRKNKNTVEYNFREKILNSSWVVVWYSNKKIDFNQSADYQLSLDWLNWFTSEWNYSIEVIIWESIINMYYFTQWDEKIYTSNDNKIEVIHNGLDYPNWIWWESLSEINEFDVTSISKMTIDKEYDTILRSPIKELDISINSSDLITFIAKYYKNYNCYNIDQNESKINTFISKFNIN